LTCKTCWYWKSVWPNETERRRLLQQNRERIQRFRDQFAEFTAVQPTLMETLPVVLTKLYSDCQVFAESEIRLTLERFNKESNARR